MVETRFRESVSCLQREGLAFILYILTGDPQRGGGSRGAGGAGVPVAVGRDIPDGEASLMHTHPHTHTHTHTSTV